MADHAALLRRRRRLRVGLSQLLCTLAGLALGIAVPRVPGGSQVQARQVSEMLIALGLGVLGAVTIIFSLLFLVMQWAATTFTPRLTLFRDAPLVWRTFAFAIGLAVFCVTAAFAIGSRTEVSVAVPAVAGLLLLVALGLLRAVQLRAFSAIQLAPVLDSIAEQGHIVLDRLGSRTSGPALPLDAPLPPLRSTLTWTSRSAVLQQVDIKGLIKAAQAADAVVVLRRAPGTALQHGTPIADVHGGELPAPAVLDALVVGTERTFEQDPMLAFRLLADIALRALSPAVNDPATSVQTLDALGDLLNRAAATRTGTVRVADRDGAVRVVIPMPRWEDFLRTGLDDVIAAALSYPMALLRIRTLLEHLRNRVPPHSHGPLTRRLAWVEKELAERFPLLWREAVRDHTHGG